MELKKGKSKESSCNQPPITGGLGMVDVNAKISLLLSWIPKILNDNHGSIFFCSGHKNRHHFVCNVIVQLY